MFETQYFGDIYIQPWELISLPFYLLFIYLISNAIQKRKIGRNPLYKFYIWGLFLKIAGGIGFVLIYMFYWHGADTTAYFECCMAMNNLFLSDPGSWFQNEFVGASWEHFYLFNTHTGFPLEYMYFDRQTYMVVRLVSPLLLFTFNSYLLTTVLLDWVAYAGIWKLFLVFSAHYPKRSNMFALAILFFPSVVFWGSGILKDTITLSCTGWILYSIYMAFILKRKRLMYIVVLFTALGTVLFIKSYIVVALFPGLLMWSLSSSIDRIHNTLVKALIIPIILVVSLGGGMYFISLFGDYMGKFALDKITTTLVVTQSDLKSDYYHGHSFDIGAIDPTPLGVLKKFPAAFIAGMFRPFIWESGNAVMLLSGLENTLILVLTLIAIVRTNIVSFFKKLIREPILFFSLSFAIFFAFSVGLSTANFGALIRFKIAYLPFFLCAIFILMKRDDEEAERKLAAINLNRDQ